MLEHYLGEVLVGLLVLGVANLFAFLWNMSATSTLCRELSKDVERLENDVRGPEGVVSQIWGHVHRNERSISEIRGACPHCRQMPREGNA